MPYAKDWFEPICKYIVDKNNGGSGFHYFLRDLTTMLVSWNFTPDDTSKNRALCTEAINALIKCSADKTKMVFNTNIRKFLC